MTKTYSEVFKLDALNHLNTLKKEGYTIVKDETIKNVRELCFYLGISSYSLYKWFRLNKEELKVLEVVKEDKEKKEEEESFEPETRGVKNELIIRSEIRLYGLLASIYGIKNYSRIPLRQLKLKIGLRLIKESGLVKTGNYNGLDSGKGSKA